MEQAQPYCPRGQTAWDGNAVTERWEDENYWYSQYHDKSGSDKVERISKKGFLVWLDKVIIKIMSFVKHK